MDNIYISVDIIGSLGNHLFQIALVLSFLNLSKLKRKLVFKYEEKMANQHNLPRKTFWNTLFKDQFNVLQPEEYDNIPFSLCIERIPHKFQELPYEYKQNILFKGYFQSFKYIDDHVREQMTNYIYSNEDLMYKAYDEYNKIKVSFNAEDDDMVSLHVRRTDVLYLSHYHNPQDLDYYKRALETVNKKHVVVFSDDTEWCKENINISLYSYQNIHFVDINDVSIKFILLSMFKHNIIASSTYSLWASFISHYENKIVVAPKTWYGTEGHHDCEEVYHNKITHII